MVGRRRAGHVEARGARPEPGQHRDAGFVGPADRRRELRPAAGHDFTATPNPALPGDTVQFDACGTHDAFGTITHYSGTSTATGLRDRHFGASTMVSTRSRSAARSRCRSRSATTRAHTSVYTHTISVTHPPTAAVTQRRSAADRRQGHAWRLRFERSRRGPGSSTTRDLNTTGSSSGDTGTASRSDQVPHARHPHRAREGHRQRRRDRSEVADVVVERLRREDRRSGPGHRWTGELSSTPAAPADPDGTIVDYDWDLDNNGSFESDRAWSRRARHVRQRRHLVLGLCVTDSAGGTATTLASSSTSPRRRSRSLTATPNPARPNQSVSLEAGPRPTPTRRGDASGGTWTATAASRPTPARPPPQTKSWATTGNRPVRVKVTEANGASPWRRG